MITRRLLTNILIGTIAVASLISAILVATAPPLSTWGHRHLPHQDERTLPLPSGHQVEQTFLLEHPQVSAAILWLDATADLPQSGNIQLELKTENGSQISTLPLANIPSSGAAFFQFPNPIKGSVGDTASLVTRLTEPNQKVHLQYQIDATIHDQGKLIYHPNLRKKGDLAFQLRYQRPALGTPINIIYPILILIAGTLATVAIATISTQARRRGCSGKRVRRSSRPGPPPAGGGEKTGDLGGAAGASRMSVRNYRDAAIAALIAITITTFYLALLIRPHTWIGPSDFTKEVSYAASSADALRSTNWPIWSHYTCGGMGLLGNPEATTLSITTLLALLATPAQAVWLTLALEAGLAAAGAYLLARALGLRPYGSVLAAVIATLSAGYAYKIVEGIVMVGGALALTPWVFLGFIQATKKSSVWWALLSTLSLLAIFGRGDVHIIAGVIAILVIWAVIETLRRRTFEPLLILTIIGSLSFLGASVKILPYLEQPSLIGEDVDPHSGQLTAQRLWDNIFLQLPSREVKVPVLHGIGEQFGYFGAYIGLLPIILTIIGLATNHRYRSHIVVALIFILIIAEGTTYEYFLRHLGPLAAIFRMPTRLLLTATLLIGLLAGIGIEKLAGRSERQQLPLALAIIAIIFITTDLGIATSTILNRNLDQRSATILATPTQPNLTPHLNHSPNNESHPSILLNSGYLLPHICGDQNNPPTFITSLTEQTPISHKPTTLSPNSITVSDVSGTEDVVIHERFVTSWVPSAGQAIATNEGAVHLISPANSPQQITLQYISPTLRAQQVLLLSIFIIATLLLIHAALTFRHRPLIRN